jgi:FeS assembly SUF system protein
MQTIIPDRTEALEEKVIQQLRTVYDPEIPVNIYDLGLVYDFQFSPAIEDRFDVRIVMTLTTPNCPVAAQMPAMVERAVAEIPELNKIKVDLTFDPPWDKSRMSDETRLQLNIF